MKAFSDAYDDNWYLEGLIEYYFTLASNINLDYLAEKGRAVQERANEFDYFDFIGDIGEVVGIALDSPSLDYISIPYFLHLELWFQELQDLVESIAKDYSKYDWTV